MKNGGASSSGQLVRGGQVYSQELRVTQTCMWEGKAKGLDRSSWCRKGLHTHMPSSHDPFPHFLQVGLCL